MLATAIVAFLFFEGNAAEIYVPFAGDIQQELGQLGLVIRLCIVAMATSPVDITATASDESPSDESLACSSSVWIPAIG